MACPGKCGGFQYCPIAVFKENQTALWANTVRKTTQTVAWNQLVFILNSSQPPAMSFAQIMLKKKWGRDCDTLCCTEIYCLECVIRPTVWYVEVQRIVISSQGISRLFSVKPISDFHLVLTVFTYGVICCVKATSKKSSSCVGMCVG